jgi:hypothetical protein
MARQAKAMIPATAPPRCGEVAGKSFLAHDGDRLAEHAACLHDLPVQFRSHLAIELLRAPCRPLPAAVVCRQTHATLPRTTLLRVGQVNDLGRRERVRQGCIDVFALPVHH